MTTFLCSLIVLTVTLIYFLTCYDRQPLDALVIWNLVYSQVLFHAPPIRPVVITIVGCMCGIAFMIDWITHSFNPIWLIVLPLLVIATWEAELTWIRRFVGLGFGLLAGCILFYKRKKLSEPLILIFLGFALGYERMAMCLVIAVLFTVFCRFALGRKQPSPISSLMIGYLIALKVGHELYAAMRLLISG